MTDRLRIFNRSGFLLAEFSVSVSRSYVLGARSTASFEVATNQTYCTDNVLNFFNWVVVESTNKPDWVGLISSRVWGKSTVTITALTPEFLLSKRIGDKETLIQGSAGMIFSEIIRQVNRDDVTILKVGEVYIGADMEETIDPTSLDRDLKRIFERSKEEYLWRPGFDSAGKLSVYGDWVKQAGVDKNFTLWQASGGGNIELNDRTLVEDAPDGNYIYGYGNGITWDAKPIAISTDTTSRNKYGLIQKSVSYYGLKTIDAIQKNADAELLLSKDSANVYNVKAIDNGDTFANLALGNVLNLNLTNVGFLSGVLGTIIKVRIIGMMYDPDNGEKIDLALYKKD